MPDPIDEIRYQAFLSYRTSDRRLATWLHRKLETYRVPRYLVGKPGPHGRIPARIRPVFRDRDELRTEQDIETIIAGNLARSRHLIVLCTPSAVEPESWVPREIEIFRRERPGAGVYAVIGAGQPPACFPEPLRTRTGEGAMRVPLAADLRPTSKGGDGRSKAFIKLVAGLLGVEFDALWRRERRRLKLRIMLLVAAALIALTGAGALLQERERTRLATIFSASERLSREDQGELADLMAIAGGPPAKGAIVSHDPAQLERLREIARRGRPSLNGFIAQLHQELNTRVVAMSRDRRLVFTTNREDGGLFVWNTAQSRLVARLPIDTSDWLRVPAGLFDRDLIAPAAISVSDDGRIIAAAYAPYPGQSRYVARWQLQIDGTCSGLCLPDVFSFTLPDAETGSFAGGRGVLAPSRNLLLAQTGLTAVYLEAGSQPVAFDFTARRVERFPPRSNDAGAECELSVPRPSRREAHPDMAGPGLLSPPTPVGGPEETVWSDRGGRSFARLPHDQRSIRFYSADKGREVARLELPEATVCVLDCGVEAVFIARGSRALIVDTGMSGFVHGTVDLDRCRFEAGPGTGVASIIASQLKPDPQNPWRFHRLRSFVVSEDERSMAALLTVSGGQYRSIGLVYDVTRRRPTTLFSAPKSAANAADFRSIIAGSGGFAFEALTNDAALPFRADGSAATPVRPAPEGRRIRLMDENQPLWESDTDHAAIARQFWTVEKATNLPARPVDFYGYRVSSPAISPDGKMLAFGQVGTVVVQPATTSGAAAARKLVVDGAETRKMAFSSDGRMLAALTEADRTNAGATLLSVWRVETGELIGQRADLRDARLLAVNDDGTAIVETSGTATLLDVRLGTSRDLFKTRHASLSAVASGYFAADHEGNTWSIDRGLHVSPTANVPFLQQRSVLAVSPDGKVAYVSDMSGDYFLNLESGYQQRFLPNQRTGVATFSRSGKLAIIVEERIEVWAPFGPAPLSIYEGDWNQLRQVWFSDDERDLHALDERGKLHRWSRSGDYPAAVAAACAALRASGARLQFSDAEMAAYPALDWGDRQPCFRIGPLAIGHYWSAASE